MMLPELPPWLRRFLFSRVSATGFGLMRIAWSLTVFFAFLLQWGSLALFYSESGALPSHLQALFLHEQFRITLFSIVTSPALVTILSLLFLLCLLATALGLAPRFTAIVSVLLLFSFHERNPLVLSGGDTLLRAVGLLLAIAPELRACSLPRLLERRSELTLRLVPRTRDSLRIRHGSSGPPCLTMSIWPYRLLLWQMIVLYGASLWYKLLGTMWLQGTAVAAALHHPAFVHVSPAIINAFTPIFPLIDYGILLFHAGWILLLIPQLVIWRFFPFLRCFSLKRVLLLLGLFFHGAIALVMVTGTFPFAVLTAYLGLMLEEDIDAVRLLVRRFSPQPWYDRGA